MGHMDRVRHPLETMRTLAKNGCYIAFDTFGQETWVFPFAPVDRITDAQRVDMIRELIDDGWIERVLLSHDVGYKHRLARYGGSGYSHILTVVIPFHMQRKGVGGDEIHMLLVENPRRVLAFV